MLHISGDVWDVKRDIKEPFYSSLIYAPLSWRGWGGRPWEGRRRHNARGCAVASRVRRVKSGDRGAKVAHLASRSGWGVVDPGSTLDI
jgi:hypothetical protein